MKQTTKYVTYLLAAIVFMNISCKNNTGNDGNLTDSLDPVEEVSLIPGADNTTLTVKSNTQAYFTLEFSNVGSNDIIGNESKDGWCIDVSETIDRNNAVYEDITLYSTDNVESWKPINYLENIREELKDEDPELSWLEIQVAIWSLRSNPDFNLNEANIEDLPSQFHNDGEPTFSVEKVNNIVDRVKAEYKDFEFTSGTKFAVIAETPPDIQTVIAFVEKD